MKNKKAELLDEKVWLEIPVQIGQLIDDYKDKLAEGFMNAKKDFAIGFSTKISPQREGGKIKVTTTMSFESEPKPEHPGKVKDKMEIVLDVKQMELPTE